MAKLSAFQVPARTILVELSGGLRREPADYLQLLDCLQDALLRRGVFLHAYSLLPRRAVLLMSAGWRAAVADVLWRLPQDSAGRCCRLLNGEEELLQAYRYADYQPVHAGLVSSPAAWYWGSYASNALGEGSELLTPHEHYLSLGRNPAQRQCRYRALCGRSVSEMEMKDREGLVLH